nr:odorant binding protein 39 [Monochamus saltuarius]
MRTCALVVCIATLVVSIQGITDEEKERVKTVHNECQADSKTHIDEELLKKYSKGEHVDKSVVGPHVLCMSTKFGTINAEGKVDKSKLKEALSRVISDETKLNEAVEKCAVDKDDAQDTALALGKCFREQAGLEGHHGHQH